MARGYITRSVAAERIAAPEHGEANTRDMAWVLADGTKHMIQLNGSNQKRWPTAPARHGAAVPESISAYTEFNSARRIRLRVTPEIKPRAFFKPSIIRGYDVGAKSFVGSRASGGYRPRVEALLIVPQFGDAINTRSA